MTNKVQMPALGESVTEGTVTRWLKEVGEEVEVDEPLLEVSTDKVDTEIPSPYAGTLTEILADEDDVVEVGGDLAVIGDADDSAGSGGDDAQAEDSADDSEGQDEAAAAEDAEESEDASAEQSAEDSSDDEAEAEEAEAAPKPAKKSSGGAAGGDTTEVKMPALGESVTEGTVTRWLKEVGEEVEVDEPLLEVSTDKVDTEVPSPVAGTVQKLLADEDDVVEVGDVVALIGSGEAAEDAADDSESDDASASAAEEDEEQPAEDAAAESSTDEDAAAAEKAEEKPQPEKQEKPQPKQQESAQTDSAPAADAQAAAAEQAGGSDSGAISQTVSHSAAYVTPLVRRLAKNKGVDLDQVTGTGVGGRIRKQDVLSAAENSQARPSSAPAGAPAAASGKPHVVEIPEEVRKLRGTTQKASRIRQTIATRMRDSLQNSAQLTQTIEVDMTRVSQLRRANKQAFQDKHGVKLTYLPFFAKAVIEALQVHPKVNATYDVEAKEITYFDHENLAIAVDTERGLLVPVIKDAGDLSIAGLSKAIDDVAERTRTAKIGPDELSGGTFTITNIGSVGALFDTPILNTPQMGILGTGVITRRPVVVPTADGGESIAIRDMVYLPLTYNHELVDGADAGRFLQTIKARLEEANFQADLEL